MRYRHAHQGRVVTDEAPDGGAHPLRENWCVLLRWGRPPLRGNLCTGEQTCVRAEAQPARAAYGDQKFDAALSGFLAMIEEHNSSVQQGAQ